MIRKGVRAVEIVEGRHLADGIRDGHQAQRAGIGQLDGVALWIDDLGKCSVNLTAGWPIAEPEYLNGAIG